MFRPEAEAASDKARRAHQGQQLHDLVHRLSHSPSEFWRERLADIDPASIRSVDDVAALPFTTAQDRTSHHPWELLTVPRDMTVRVAGSPGRAESVIAYTAQDMRLIADMCARALVAAGGSSDDLLHVALGGDAAMFGFERGGELSGATVIPCFGADTERLLHLVEVAGITGLVCTPADALLLIASFEAARSEVAGLRYVVTPSPDDDVRQQIADGFAALAGHEVPVRGVFSLPGTIGPGIGADCGQGPDGMHVHDDHVLPEIIDPATGRRLADGKVGELVLTTLTLEAMPLLRFRTGLHCAVLRGSCPCGRTHSKIGPISVAEPGPA